MDEPESTDRLEDLNSYGELALATEPILALLEELPDDTKYDALVNLLDSLEKLPSQKYRACIFTRFVDTAVYLASSLRDRFRNVNVLTGSTSIADREEAVAAFIKTGGILIATEAVDTLSPDASVVVFYDIPLDPAVLEARIGQFVRIGRRSPVRVVSFTDEAMALVIERLQRRIADIKETLSGSEIENALFGLQLR